MIRPLLRARFIHSVHLPGRNNNSVHTIKKDDPHVVSLYEEGDRVYCQTEDTLGSYPGAIACVDYDSEPQDQASPSRTRPKKG